MSNEVELIQKEVLHPNYYGGGDNPYEAIKVIEAWDLNFSLGSAVKYICRAGEKKENSALQDLIKARNYIDFEIERQKRINSQKAEMAKHYEDKIRKINHVGTMTHMPVCVSGIEYAGENMEVEWRKPD